jgi:hypothetical protein
MKLMHKLKAFINGIREFRLSMTTHYDDDDLLDWYDRGREFAHSITLRKYES